MAMAASTKNVAADAVAATVDAIALYTADPDASSGTANEVTGGSPAYARKAPTFAAASGGVATAPALLFDVPAGTTITHVGYWSGAVWRGSDPVPNETFAAQGQLEVVPSIDFSA